MHQTTSIFFVVGIIVRFLATAAIGRSKSVQKRFEHRNHKQ